MTTEAVAERRFDGPVVLVQCETDPGDMGEPREVWDETANATIVFIPSFDLWPGPTSPYVADDPSRVEERARELDAKPNPVLVAALWSLHQVDHDQDGDEWCDSCKTAWPCPTVDLLRGRDW